ncbi:hypothetical protein M569_11833, partial [Genlisea aurea]
ATFLTILLLFLLPAIAVANVFTIRNNCPYTVWAAALPGGGRRLDPSQVWRLGFTQGPMTARIWARTNCNFDANGNGRCLTGDCNGKLQCQSNGSPPQTLAEYGLNDFALQDFYKISLMEGFNVPIMMTPTSNGCRRPVGCSAGDMNGQCPAQLRTAGGCNNPCTVFKTASFCCTSGPTCGPTNMSRFFKARCRDAFTFPMDDPTSTFTCPMGTNYNIVFCP